MFILICKRVHASRNNRLHTVLYQRRKCDHMLACGGGLVALERSRVPTGFYVVSKNS